ncbi:MAG: hypothetical protein ING70_10790 [Rhodocyclaceae bacterium]|jgi:hypothetical protein|nr:hypothetical protein [Rhodocyclaceae bacterium]MCA3146133.1 hypothetical protein [Rhodocyclaceae bacterium]
MPALAIRLLLTGCAAAALAGCAASGPPMSVPLPARMVVLDSMERGAAPAPLVVYSFSTGCEAGLGALSRTVDVNRADLCEGFSAALGAGVRLLPHALGQFGAGYAGTPSEEALAQYRLVIRLIPEQYPGGRRDQGLGRGLRQRYAGELSVAARLYRISDGALVRHIRYSGRVFGVGFAPEDFRQVGQGLGVRVARDFGLGSP